MSINNLKKRLRNNMKITLCRTVDIVPLNKVFQVEYKLDGIRAYVEDSVVYNRSGKPIPNTYIQEKFKHLEGSDGELIIGNSFRETQSVVMSKLGQIDKVKYIIFDNFKRPGNLIVRTVGMNKDHVIGNVSFKTQDEVQLLLNKVLLQGYEGLILKDPTLPYIEGRNKQSPIKIKDIVDDEAEILGVIEGTGKYSGMLGALTCKWGDQSFEIGTGFTDKERTDLWKNKPIGKLAKFKYLNIGIKVLPRQPVFLGLRSQLDLGE